MGLFDLLGEVVSVPVRIAGSVAKTAIKGTGHMVTADLDAAERDLEDASNEVNEDLNKLIKSLRGIR